MLERNDATVSSGTVEDAATGLEAAAIAGMVAPLGEADPCGPDLDLDGDADYLNYFASVEGILPTSFFSEDGRPFDRASVDLPAQLEAIKPLLARSRDLRLLILRARLMIFDRNLAGFAVSLAAIAECLERFWDDVHPRPQDGNLAMRQVALSVLELPTVLFPLQYATLFEAPRIGTISYRSWMIANGEVKERPGDIKLTVGAIVEARSDAEAGVLAVPRRHVVLAKTSLARIRSAFTLKGASAGLENLPALVDKVLAFIDPAAARAEAQSQAATQVAEADGAAGGSYPAKSAAGAVASLADARQALAAIADYYGRAEPSSPTLLLVRQAHQLVGKSFIEVINLLVPAQLEDAMFRIGNEQYFELPVGKLSELMNAQPVAETAGSLSQDTEAASEPEARDAPVETRSQAIALLDQVSRYFRHTEPSSPVPMLCERARVLAERDFMSLLRDVLPRSAFKTLGE